MPEVLLSIPPLQISTGNSSEAETPTASSSNATDRSSASEQSVDAVEPQDHKLRRPSNVAQAKIKGRKSIGKRSQKKLSLNMNSQQKNTAGALKLKSRIPRPLVLSPSTSSSASTTLTTDSNLRPSVTQSIRTEENTITTVLQRQKTGIILAYRQRKSISQMDLKHYRRNMQLQHSMNGSDCNSLVAANNYMQSKVAFAHNDSSFVHKMYQYNELGYGIKALQDPRMVGMKIFVTIMLNAWRKRREEVKRLLEEITELKRGATKSRNQLHVLNSLFRVEQKRNDDLNGQIKRYLDDINTIKSTCESLTTSIISLRADKALLEQQLHTKEQESGSLTTLLTQTKSELFKSMASQRDLQANISTTQRKVQNLENQKNDLINEIFELNIEAHQTKGHLRAEIVAKVDELIEAQNEISNLEDKLVQLTECKAKESLEKIEKEAAMRKDIEKLEDEVAVLRSRLESTIGGRLKKYWYNTLAYPGITLQMLHWLAFCLLPAMPPPKPKAFPFGLSLNKFLSIVRR